MGIIDKFRKKKGKEPSDVELYNAYLVHMGDKMKMARSGELPSGTKLEKAFEWKEGLATVMRVRAALSAVEYGIRAYRVFHPLPPPESGTRESLLPFSMYSIHKQFGGEFATEYRRLKRIEEQVSLGGANDELVDESIELMEKLAKIIREMLGLV